MIDETDLTVAVSTKPEAYDAHHVVVFVSTLKDGSVKGGKAFVCAKQAAQLKILVATHHIPHHDNSFVGALVLHDSRRR